jgi:hypothetical protein
MQNIFSKLRFVHGKQASVTSVMYLLKINSNIAQQTLFGFPAVRSIPVSMNNRDSRSASTDGSRARQNSIFKVIATRSQRLYSYQYLRFGILLYVTNYAAVNHNPGQAFDTNSTPRNIVDGQDSTFFHPRTSNESTGIHISPGLEGQISSLFHINKAVQQEFTCSLCMLKKFIDI